MKINPILNIDNINVYEHIVYLLDKPFYDDYLDMEVVSVSFVSFPQDEDLIRVHFYGNPNKEHTYHPYYFEVKDKIKLVGIDDKNTEKYMNLLKRELNKWKTECELFTYVISKAKGENVK